MKIVVSGLRGYIEGSRESQYPIVTHKRTDSLPEVEARELPPDTLKNSTKNPAKVETESTTQIYFISSWETEGESFQGNGIPLLNLINLNPSTKWHPLRYTCHPSHKQLLELGIAAAAYRHSASFTHFASNIFTTSTLMDKYGGKASAIVSPNHILWLCKKACNV